MNEETLINEVDNKFVIHAVDFDIVLPLWDLLHPGREHKKYAKMIYKGKNVKWTLSEDELNITFFGAYANDKLCGTLGLHLTPNNLYRARAFYVLPEYRRQGLGGLLLEQIIQTAKDLGGDGIWGYPNNIALPLYIRAGFIKKSEFEKADWGTNCYVKKTFIEEK